MIRDAGTRARLGELYREAWGELMKVPYYAAAAKEPSDSAAGKMIASARHLGEHLGEAPVLILACIAIDAGAQPSLTTGSSIYLSATARWPPSSGTTSARPWRRGARWCVPTCSGPWP